MCYKRRVLFGSSRFSGALLPLAKSGTLSNLSRSHFQKGTPQPIDSITIKSGLVYWSYHFNFIDKAFAICYKRKNFNPQRLKKRLGGRYGSVVCILGGTSAQGGEGAGPAGGSGRHSPGGEED